MFEVAEDPARPLNTLVLADGDHEVAYRKIHLYDSFGYEESRTISAGRDRARRTPRSAASRSG